MRVVLLNADGLGDNNDDPRLIGKLQLFVKRRQ